MYNQRVTSSLECLYHHYRHHLTWRWIWTSLSWPIFVRPLTLLQSSNHKQVINFTNITIIKFSSNGMISSRIYVNTPCQLIWKPNAQCANKSIILSLYNNILKWVDVQYYRHTWYHRREFWLQLLHQYQGLHEVSPPPEGAQREVHLLLGFPVVKKNHTWTW